jgi:hypothetical protein
MTQTPPLPLFYSQITPLDAQKHAGWGLKSGLDLSFAKNTHAVPVNMIECPQLAAHYPIVFSPDTAATPVAVMGLRDGENLFVTNQGQWIEPDAYIPAYIRRYPFLLAAVTGTDQLTLCIDNVPTVVDPHHGTAFFKPDAQASDLTQNALEFCKSFHAATLQTIEFSSALHQAGLLVERSAEIPLPGGQPPIKFGGFRIVDESKLANLPDATWLEWRKKGYVPALYACLMATGRWGHLARLYVERRGLKAA